MASRSFLKLFGLRRVYRGRLSLGWLANPWVIAAIVATAVAIPIAIHTVDGADGVPVPTPTPTLTTSPTESGWYWKPGGFTDYAPSGMPDFDQKQGGDSA